MPTFTADQKRPVLFTLIGRFTPAGPDAPRLRAPGSVEAGFPSPAEEELVDTLSLDEFLIQNREASFLLKVSGDSMTGAGILPGDMVIVDKGLAAKSGDIVIAQVDGEWTMKFLRRRGESVLLVPANPKYRPIAPQTELKIAGVVTAVVRKYQRGSVSRRKSTGAADQRTGSHRQENGDQD